MPNFNGFTKAEPRLSITVQEGVKSSTTWESKSKLVERFLDSCDKKTSLIGKEPLYAALKLTIEKDIPDLSEVRCVTVKEES